MNREVKFDCIVIDSERQLYISRFTEWIDGDGWKHDYYAPLVTNGVFHDEELGDGFFGEITRRQYTGLKDKNGKEIFEGDIYKTSTGNLYKVMFISGAFVGGQSESNCVPLSWTFDGDEITEDGTGFLEVIGNIYENKTLLTP